MTASIVFHIVKIKVISVFCLRFKNKLYICIDLLKQTTIMNNCSWPSWPCLRSVRLQKRSLAI